MDDRIALALSGGGVRAMAFHAGVLRHMADQGQLERVSALSTVSGGSLIAGLVIARCSMRWPTSAEYPEVLRAVRALLTGVDVQNASIARAFWPGNWRFLAARPNIVARTIYRDWKIRCALGDLPREPSWSINCTTAENGRRFRFRDGSLGDHEIGYADARKFPMASAMAISAAFPVGLGPFSLDARRLAWRKRPTWNGAQDMPIDAPYRALNLYDGGLYDNLGLEPFFDAATCRPKGAYRIMVSDAGAALERGFGLGAINPLRVKRLMDVMMDQNRALRVRGFVRYISDTGNGSYIGINRSPASRELLARQPDAQAWLTDAQAKSVAEFATSLHALTPDEFDLIERHGYEAAALSMSAAQASAPASEPIVVPRVPQATAGQLHAAARDSAPSAHTAH